MDPGKILRTEIKKHFPAFGSIRKVISYQSMNNSAYDPDSGIVTPVIDQTYYVDVIFSSITSYDKLQDNDEINLAIDKSIIVPALDMQSIPQVNDTFLLDSAQWRVKGIKEDPANATYKMWVRPTIDDING